MVDKNVICMEHKSKKRRRTKRGRKQNTQIRRSNQTRNGKQDTNFIRGSIEILVKVLFSGNPKKKSLMVIEYNVQQFIAKLHNIAHIDNVEIQSRIQGLVYLGDPQKSKTYNINMKEILIEDAATTLIRIDTIYNELTMSFKKLKIIEGATDMTNAPNASNLMKEINDATEQYEQALKNRIELVKNVNDAIEAITDAPIIGQAGGSGSSWFRRTMGC
jgi:hypothetical protein